jgi:hypothetical protein
MNHPAELALHKYMSDASNGASDMSEETIQQVGKDVMDALRKQFGKREKRKFRLRMSNVGRPTCQLWYEKNKPELATPKSNNFIMNMMLGDIVEAVFKGLLTEAKIQYEDNAKVVLELPNAKISGEYDIVMDGAVDDIKSASDWSYRNKFESYHTLASGDAFGYISQLAGYARAAGKKAGGWWVVNKARGSFKYVTATPYMDVDAEIKKIEAVVDKVEENKFERCFEPVKETFRKEETGNLILNKNCSFCSYRFDCWPDLQELPAVKSKAKEPPIVPYIKLCTE